MKQLKLTLSNYHSHECIASFLYILFVSDIMPSWNEQSIFNTNNYDFNFFKYPTRAHNVKTYGEFDLKSCFLHYIDSVLMG